MNGTSAPRAGFRFGFSVSHWLPVLVLAVLLQARPTLAEENEQPGPAATHGRELAELNCARCHAIGVKGSSTHQKAPPFWAMSNRRPVETVAQMLLNKATPKDSDMPHFSITRKQAEDLAEWIAWVQPVAHGERLARQNCSRCHAIGADDTSKHDKAPAFRDISKQYPTDALEEAFSEGVYAGHPDMPVFRMSPTQIEDLLAYMDSLIKP